MTRRVRTAGTVLAWLGALALCADVHAARPSRRKAGRRPPPAKTERVPDDVDIVVEPTPEELAAEAAARSRAEDEAAARLRAEVEAESEAPEDEVDALDPFADGEADAPEPDEPKGRVFKPSLLDPDARHEQRQLAAGSTLLIVGGSLGIGALAMGVSDPCARPAGNGCSREGRNRAALTMLGPALALSLVGSVLVGLTVSKRRKRERMAWGPGSFILRF